ncbi:MAG: type II toxin-antitoxin system PemK/MazF family toxin [Bryobacterales bacterium]|nr:type II toxin-antitoxin system PemK/MazF family toxin [Bryobacterales bacterium]
MQFHQTQGSKIRPALVLLDTGDDDFVAAPVTQTRSSAFDLSLVDWQAAGLNVPSSARIHKLTVLPKSNVVRKLGVCSASDRAGLQVALCKTFCPEVTHR